MKYKLLLLSICALGNSSMVYAQGKSVSAVPMRIETGISKIVQDQGDGKVLYGYCSPDFQITSKTGIGFNTEKNLEITAAIRLSEGITTLLKDRKVYRLKIGVASDTEATIFIRKSDGSSLKEIKQKLVLGWNDIVLDTPLSLPEEKEIYIGYSCIHHPEKYVIAAANTSSKFNGVFIGIGNDPLVAYSELGNLCVLAEVDGTESEFEYVGSISSAYSSKPYLCNGANESSEVSLKILNEGEKNVSTVKLGRSFNGTELSDTVCYFKRTLRANSIGELTLKVTPSKTGSYTYTLKEMGETPVAASTRKAKFSLYDSQNIIPRMVLMEEFTSQSCGNCPAAQNALHKLIFGYEDRVAMVLHHSGYYADEFSIAESDAYCYFYNTEQTYAPAMTMDRTYIAELDPKGIEGLVFDPRNLPESRFSKQLELPAMVSVGIKSVYDEATRKLTVTVSGYKITDLVGDHVGLTVFLLESKYIANQIGRTSYEHNDFPRHVLSAVDGDIITFNGNSYSKEYTFIVPETFISTAKKETTAHPENMHIVAFVSNFDWKLPDNCMILNANKTISLNDIVTGVATEKMPNQSLQVYVTDGRVCVANDYKTLNVYDLQGMSVCNENLIPGIYLVKVILPDGKELVSKVIR